MTRENRRLIEAREACSWTQDEEAERLHGVAAEMGEPAPRADGKTIAGWEHGKRRPGPYHTRLLCRLHGRTAQELGLGRQEEQAPADSSDLGPEAAALDLARRILASDLDEETMEAVDAAVQRLCCDYSATPPALLVPRTQTWLWQMNDLLGRRLGLGQHRQLLAHAGWLHLLL